MSELETWVHSNERKWMIEDAKKAIESINSIKRRAMRLQDEHWKLDKYLRDAGFNVMDDIIDDIRFMIDDLITSGSSIWGDVNE